MRCFYESDQSEECISAFLDWDTYIVGSVQYIVIRRSAEWYWIVLIYRMMPCVLSVHALTVAISQVDRCFPTLIFLLVILLARYAVPDAWRLWAGPRLAYCCG